MAANARRRQDPHAFRPIEDESERQLVRDLPMGSPGAAAIATPSTAGSADRVDDNPSGPPIEQVAMRLETLAAGRFRSRR